MNRTLDLGRTAFKLGVAGALVGSGLHHLISRLRAAASGPRVHVLGYHRVVDVLDEDGPINPALCITADAFRRQMEQVRQHFTVLSLGEAIAAVEGRLRLPGDRDACAVTFDDGYRDVLLRAHPIVESLGVPATVFVPTGYAGAERYLPHDRLYASLWQARRQGVPLGGAPVPRLLRAHVAQAERTLAVEGPAITVENLIATLPSGALEQVAAGLEDLLGPAPRLDAGARVLDPDEVRALADGGWEIGAHTVGHVVLTREPPARVEHELLRSKQDLERWSGRPCRYFAYCNGYHSRSLVAAVARAGYEGAVTTCDRPNRPGGDRLRISRKVLWDAHARGLDGRWSPTLSAAHLHDLFGDLGLTTPVDGEVADKSEPREVESWAYST